MLKTGARVATHATSFSPRPFESIDEWGRRVGGDTATDYLLIPALGGIYAGDPDRLSASLIFGKARLPDHLRSNKPEKGTLHGTVAPPEGMQQLTDALRAWLEQAGGEFVFNSDAADRGAHGPVAICLSRSAAADCLSEVAPEISEALSG